MNQTATLTGDLESLKVSVNKEILIYALIYATSILNTSPHKVIENIKLNFDKLSVKDLKMISNEIIDSGIWGHEYYGQQWKDFLNDIEEEIKRRIR